LCRWEIFQTASGTKTEVTLTISACVCA